MTISDQYLELGLRLGRHVDGLVDSYYGPDEISARIDAEPLRDSGALAGDAARLLEALDGAELEEGRARWLRAQLVGLETVARRLAGEEIPFADEVERCYGVRPRRVPEDDFEAAHRALDEILPGDGSLAERYQAWREGNPLEIERLAPLLEAIAADLRARTAALFGLPEGERAELDYVSDEPWTAFNYYLGGLRSRVAFNMDVPMAASLVTGLIAHEIYPGHHTEHAWKEQRVVRERGYLEESINLVGTPQGLVSEGIAGLAPEIVVDDEDPLTAEHLARLGIAYDADLNRSVRRAARPLDGVSVNAAQLIHEEGAPTEDVREYLRRWGLRSERRAELNLRFIADPVWRSYITTYTDGYYLCRDFVGDDPARYRRLLTEQLTPADLELQARV